MPRTSSPFTTLRSEGALLPAELLARIADADKELGGLVPTDYHLGETERLGEAIARSWNRLVGVWASFESSLDAFNPNDPGTGVTRERWLAPLFQELGFGRLQVAKAREIDGTDYPISHEWSSVPIHLVGAGVELERRTKGVAGAARMSPHALVQDYLNRTEALWGIVSNGRELRLLRDNVSLTRQAYLNFDIEAMFSGEVYADFALLWLTCHQSRFESQDDKVAECWLERWTQSAQAQGTRALNTLREGVEIAISTLGAGFVAHPTNAALRETLRSGELAAKDYYRELLRLIYRLIFLFVAEDRALLHTDATDEEARSRYRDFYSMTRLRHVAERLRGGSHPDLWRSFVFVCAKLADDEGCDELGLPFLGSSLFSHDACPHLDAAELANRDLLRAVRALAFTEQRRILRLIDYRNMGSEELGSIYESLLELHPEVHHESGSFSLATAAGNERKTTGSYYTPTSLISALLDTALDPVLDAAASERDAEASILDLKVLDPACGSGHFLVAAAHRIAKRLAAHRTDEPEPSPGAYRAALREVISRCIYGIDVNPMAVELCKVSLWMEAVEPGKPLSFLEHHIVCGNSLLGTTPALLASGIPDAAFTALEGDDKGTVKSLKARNKLERTGQASLFGEAAHPDLVGPIATKIAALEANPDDSPEALRAKQQAWDALAGSDQLAHAKLIADTWCASFVIEKTPGLPVLTQGVLELLEREPTGGDPKLHAVIDDLATRYRFLHPHLAFPQVFHVPGSGEILDDPDQGWSGGFSAVIGNPPWSRVKLQERQYFASRAPAIATAPNKAARSRLLLTLKDDDPALWSDYQIELRRYDAEGHFFHHSGRFPLTGVGDVNTYALFAERARQLLGLRGRSGLIVQTGIATDDTTKAFFGELVDSQSLVTLYGFENEEKLFADVHNQTKFCVLVTAASGSGPAEIELSFGNRQVSDVLSHKFTLTAADIHRVNPNTRTCPVFRSSRDAEIVTSIHERIRVLIRETGGAEENPWGIRFQRMFDMANDSELFKTAEELEADGWRREGVIYRRDGLQCLPLLEGKMIDLYNPRAGTYEGQTQAQANKRVLPDTPLEVLQDPSAVNFPHYWVSGHEVAAAWHGECDWAIGWRDVGPKERTLLTTIVPKWAVGHKLPLIHLDRSTGKLGPCLLASLSSFLVDYLTRVRTEKGSMTYFILKQLPVLEPAAFNEECPWNPRHTIAEWILPRVVELTFTALHLSAFGHDFGYESPFRWDEDRRSMLTAELDACIFQLYGVGIEDAEFVLDSFYLVSDDEHRRFGEYLSKRLILDELERMESASRNGVPLDSRLDPSPGDPALVHLLAATP